MNPRIFTRLRTQSPALEAIQDNIQKFVRQLEVNPLIDGRLVSGITHDPTTGNTPVIHGLGRIPIGAIMVAGSVWPVPVVVKYTVLAPTLTTLYTYSTDARSGMQFDLWVF